MKKITSLAIFLTLLSLLVIPTVSAQSSSDDLIEEPETTETVENWNIVDVSFSPKLLTNIRTGKHVLKITPTFEYKSGGEDISFQDSYIWNVHCSMSVPGNPVATVLFSGEQEFPTNAPNGVSFDSGNRVTSTVIMEFDKKLVRYLKRRTVPMACSFGYAKPLQYQHLSMGYGSGVFPSYLLTLKGNKWQVKGWDF